MRVERLEIRGLAVIGLMVLMVGCGNKAPQIPSQRKGQAPKADSATLAMMALNAQLAQTADQAVMEAAQAQEEAYALYEGNIWMHIVDPGDMESAPLQAGKSCIVHMRIYTLDNRLLEDTEGTYMLGKNELPSGVEWMVYELHHGAQARLFVPWYMAFGAQGNTHVPPYENVRIHLELR